MLGTHLIAHLYRRGYRQIRGLYLPGGKDDPPSDQTGADLVEWVEGDVLDLPSLEEAIHGIDWVIHGAGIISFDRRDAQLMRQVNVEGTANVVNLCLDYGVEKLLHVSSVAALGRSKPGQTISETSKWERSPYNTRYGISKFLGEQEVWRGIEEGLSAVIVNPSIILGPGRWDQGPARFFPMLHGGFPFYPLGATALVDARDVASMILALLESDIKGERFIATAGHLTYKSLFELITTHLNLPAPRYALHPFLQYLGLWASQLKSLWSKERGLVTRETIRQSALEFYYDHSKSQKRLGFEYTPIEQTIAYTAERYLTSLGYTALSASSTTASKSSVSVKP